jgi:Tfp pilus assembly protein PilN
VRELEFLPAWYPHLRRKKRLVVLITWAAGMLVLTMALWLGFNERAVQQARGALLDKHRELAQRRAELRQLDELMDVKRQLKVQEQIMAKLGTHVEITRMLSELSQAMPREMSLLDLSIDTVEQVRKVDNVQAVAKAKDQPIDRKLQVRLQGVAPSDVDLANFITKLGENRFFDNVTVVESADHTQQGHVMRKFEVTFNMDLGAPTRN